MGTFSKIKKYSKSSSYIDEKIENFNAELRKTILTEALPANNTSQIYLVEPEADGIVDVNPEPVLDLTADDATQSGTDTTGIFDEFGNSVLIDPPGTWQIQDGPTSDPSASLGPMISYYDSASNTTYLGYVRQSDRSMINLGRITGQMSTWNGTSNFVSYGQLTLAQAQWYQTEHNSGRVQNYRVFYAGKSDNTDPYHRVFGKVINTPKGDGSNPWAVYTSTPISSDQEITVKFYFDGGSLYAGARPPVFYDTNSGLPNGITAVDTVNFTVPAGDGVDLQQGQNGGGFNINGIGLKWRYLRGPENPFGHDEPDGDPNGVSVSYHPDDYFVWYMTINGKNYPLPAGLQGMTAAIGIPGGFGNWNQGSANSKSGSGKYSKPGKVPPVMGGFDKNLPPGSANPRKKSDAELARMGLYRGSDGKVYPIKGLQDKPAPYDAMDPVNLALARLGLGGLGALRDWGNKGKNERIPNEDASTWEKLWADDLKQRGQSDAAFARGDKPPLFGRPDQAFNPFRPAEKGGPGSGPTPAIRQLFGRGAKPGTASGSESSKNKKQNQKNSYELKGQVLTENAKKIIQEIKKPYQLPEEKREKIKYRPRVIGAPPRSVGADMMKKAEVPSSFKPMEEKAWGKKEKYQNARLSQERKNQVLDFIGTSDHAWEWITETLRNKGHQVAYENFNAKDLNGDTLYTIKDEKGNNNYVFQSEIDDQIYRSYFGKYLNEQETIQANKDPLFRRVKNRLNSVIDYPDKPSKLGYPDVPPPESVNGWHPDYGQKVDYYNKLDSQSAEAMPPTGNSEIDANVRRAKTLKKVLGKKLDTRTRS